MNEEEKFVIKTLKDSQNAYIENTKVKKVELSTDEAKVVLNLIKKQQKELKKKDRIIRKLQIECQKNFDLAMDTEIERIEANQIINKMAEQLAAGLTILNNNIEEALILVDKQEVIDYFTNLVEKEDK